MEWIPKGLSSMHAPVPVCVQSKLGQKRPVTSPAPTAPSPHHMHHQASPHNHVPGLPAHISSQSLHHHQQIQQQQQQHKSQQPSGASSRLTPGEQSFAAALRNLAKQQSDGKEEDGQPAQQQQSAQSPAEVRNSNHQSSGERHRESDMRMEQQRQSSRSASDARANDIRKHSSPQPPEKMARLSSSAGSASVAANIQSELLARSGFQPYRPDERLAHPAGPFPLDAYSPFGGIPGLSPGAFLNPSLAYHEAMYMDPRFQTLLRQNHPHALYQQMASPYGPHLYGMMSGAPPSLAIPGYHERLKLEEEHRVRTMRAEEEKAREHEEKARKEQQDRDEKLRREQQEREEKLRREQKEKEQREKEKEMQMREQRQKESEARERERQMQHHLAALHASPMQRQFGHMLNMFPMGMGLRPPSMMQHSLNPLSAHSMIQSGLGMSPHSLPMFGGNLPPPAHGYSNSMLGPPGSIVTPPSIASIASIGNNHYSPQMNHSPVPAAPQRDPQRDARERDMRDQRDQRELREHRASPQSLNLSKNPGNLANLSNLTNNLAAPLSLTTSKSNPSQPIAAPPVVSAVNLGINQINLSNSNAAGNNGQREMSGSLLVNLSNPGSIGVKAEKELIKDEPSDAMKAFKVDKVETNLKMDEKVELNLKMEDKMDEKLEKLVKSEIEEIPANLVKKEEPKNPKSPAEVVDKVEPSDKDEDKVVTPEPPKAKTPESIPEAVPAVSPQGNDKTAERAESPSEELPKTNPKSLETKNSAVKPKENEIKANDEFVTSKKR